MNTIISISIPEPCHENWDNMTPNEKGRFCNACAKTVVDFSVMTDTQVLNYLIDKQHEKVCGRLLPEQVDMPISAIQPVKKKMKWYWNAAAAIALLFSKSENAHAQKQPVKSELSPVIKEPGNTLRGQLAAVVARPQTERPARNVCWNSVMGDVQVKSTSVQEKSRLSKAIFSIRDEETGLPVPGAMISITDGHKKQLISHLADANGKITINDFSRNEIHIVKVAAGAYLDNEFIIAADRGDTSTWQQDVYLQKLPAQKNKELSTALAGTVGGLSIKMLAGNKVSCTKDTSYLFKIAEPLKPGPEPTPVTPENILPGQQAVRIYPNPVSRGNAMLMAWVVKQKGPHMILVNDAAGLLVWQKQEILIPGKIQSSILTDEKWSSGMYYVRILNPEGKQIAENSFIVQ